MSDGVLDRVQLRLVDSVESAGELLRWLSERDVVGLDCETTGLSPERDRLKLVQFGDERTGWAVPFTRWGGVAEDAIRRFRGTWVTHNGISFDAPFLRKEGIELPRERLEDVMFMGHVLDSTGSLALKNLADHHVDPRCSAGQRILDEAMKRAGYTWETVPETFEPYWTYGALDAVITRLTRDVLRPRVDADAPLSYQLETATAWCTEKMMRLGFKVDRDHAQRFSDSLTTYCEQVDAWVKTNYGILPGANDDVARILIRDGVDLTKRTTTGARFSVDKEVLAEVDHPLAQAVLGRRQAWKVVSTYLAPLLNLSVHDGRVHPSINPVGGRERSAGESAGKMGVRTGRMSISAPSVQNWPKHTQVGERVRDCVVASEGNRFVKCDFDQVEMRIMAHVSRDAGMIRAFVEEGDFFVNMTREIFIDPTIEKKDPRRQTTKNAGYSKIYGAGIEKFALTAHIDEGAAAAFMRRFDELYPGPRRFARAIDAEARQRLLEEGVAYVRSPLTQRRHIADPRRMYALVNYLIQGTAAEVLKMKIVELEQAGLGHRVVFPVHDEVDLDVPRDEEQDAVATLRDVMNDPNLLSVPITATVSVGERWGSTRDVV